MRNTEIMRRLGALSLLCLALAACSKKEEEAVAPEATPAATAAAPAPETPNCHPALQKLMQALPAAHEVDGQKESGRDCKSGTVTAVYGVGDPVEIRYELTALRYEDSDLEPLGQKDGQALLDNLRKTMEAKITIVESQLKGAQSTAGDASVDVMTPAERAKLPRPFTLPNGVQAMISEQSGTWELDSVLSDRHMLVIQWTDNRQENSTDAAEATFKKLVAVVHFDQLKP